jgi:CheY-like chemotaxis protein
MKLNILLVDDDQAVSNVIGGQLQIWGYNLYEAANGLEALKKLIQMADPISTSCGEITISISYGTAAYDENISLDHIIGIADQAVYQQKQAKKKAAGSGQ